MEGNSKMDEEKPFNFGDLEEVLVICDKDEGKGKSVQENSNENPATADIKTKTDPMKLPKAVSGQFVTFNVKYKDKMQKICLPAKATVAELHLNISSFFDICPTKHILHGCGLHANALESENDSKKLSSLKLTAFNYILVEESDSPQMSIDIVVEPTGRKFNLNMSSATTFGELKEHVYYITNIPVRYQEWSGAPKEPQEKFSEWGDQVLKVSSLKTPSSPISSASSSDEGEESASSFESSSLDEELNLTGSSSASDAIGANMLISDGRKTQLEGNKEFVENYKKIYGEPSLEFFVGGLENAYFLHRNQANDENKLLAIYLHHCDSILSNIFCQNVLKNDDVLAIFKNLFLVYGWDMSRTSNAIAFQKELECVITKEVAEAAMKIELDQFPAFLIIGKKKCGITPKVTVIHGDHDVGELLKSLHYNYTLLSQLHTKN